MNRCRTVLPGVVVALTLGAFALAPAAQAAPVSHRHVTAPAGSTLTAAQKAAGEACASEAADLQNELDVAQYSEEDFVQADYGPVDAALAVTHGADCAQFPDITRAPLAVVDQKIALAKTEPVGATTPNGAFCTLDDAIWTLAPMIYNLRTLIGDQVLKPVRSELCQ